MGQELPSDTTARVVEILGLQPFDLAAADLDRAIAQGLPCTALSRLVARLGLTGVARGALRRRIVRTTPLIGRLTLTRSESERTARVATVLALAELLWNDRERAQRFLKRPHGELGGRSPLDCAADDDGAVHRLTTSPPAASQLHGSVQLITPDA
jgi:putative toxin-antitoxin system antitoxin component (TIGR02293 family)